MARTNDSTVRRGAGTLPVLPAAALDRLAQLHVETSEVCRLTFFLRGSVHAASLFMLMATCVLFLGGGASLARNFSWALSIFLGVAALLYSHIRNMAAAFDRAPVSDAARGLRRVFFYMGLAWGSGAFLATPAALPAYQAVPFAVIPVLLLAFLLNDAAALLAFLVPTGAVTVCAAFARGWPDASLDAVLIPLLQAGAFLATLLRRPLFPAGLALR